MKIKWHYFGCKRCVRSSNFSLRFVKSLQASSQLALVRSIIGMKCCFLIHQNRILCHIKNQKGATRTSQGFSYLSLRFVRDLQVSSQLTLVRDIIGMEGFSNSPKSNFVPYKIKKGATLTSQNFSYLKLDFCFCFFVL